MKRKAVEAVLLREEEGGDRTQARVGSSNSGGNGNGSSRFTFNEHNGDMSYGPFFDNEKLRISTAVGPDLRSLRPGEEAGRWQRAGGGEL